MKGLIDISLEDKELYDKYFWESQYDVSDLNFTNLYIWKDLYPIKHIIMDNFLCVFVEYKDTLPYVLMPAGTGDLKKVILNLINFFKENNTRFLMEGITEKFKEKLSNLFPDRFHFTSEEDIYDYVYLTEDLINLKGKKYHSKRNHINKFNSLYNYTYVPLTEERITECCEINNIWYSDKIEGNDLKYEKIAIKRALEDYSELNYKGALLKVDGKVIAYTIGELLNNNMAVIHFEKADSTYKGSYAAINQLFCQNEWSNIKYINREEDMGIEGLRKSKKSYKPIKMIKKYNAYLKEEIHSEGTVRWK